MTLFRFNFSICCSYIQTCFVIFIAVKVFKDVLIFSVDFMEFWSLIIGAHSKITTSSAAANLWILCKQHNRVITGGQLLSVGGVTRKLIVTWSNSARSWTTAHDSCAIWWRILQSSHEHSIYFSSSLSPAATDSRMGAQDYSSQSRLWDQSWEYDIATLPEKRLKLLQLALPATRP